MNSWTEPKPIHNIFSSVDKFQYENIKMTDQKSSSGAKAPFNEVPMFSILFHKCAEVSFVPSRPWLMLLIIYDIIFNHSFSMDFTENPTIMELCSFYPLEAFSSSSDEVVSLLSYAFDLPLQASSPCLYWRGKY